MPALSDRMIGEVLASDECHAAQFYIPASVSLQELQPRTLKHNDTFAVFDHYGDIAVAGGGTEGLFHRDTRHLSKLMLTLGGARPMLLSSTICDDNASLNCDLANPDIFNKDGNILIGHDLLHLRRSKFLWQGTCFERISVRNYDEQVQRVELALHFSCDFADLFEVRGVRRDRRGKFELPCVEPDGVTLSYLGLDGVRRITRLRFEPRPTRIGPDYVFFDFSLVSRERQIIFTEISCADLPARKARDAFLFALRDSRRASRAAMRQAVAVTTSNEIFNEAVRRAISDLYTLATNVPEGLYPYAGIPWFSAVFGRDGIITAMQTLWLDPTIARGVLLHLAANQALVEDAASDAEPGKILHEVRFGEMAECGEVPFRRYYGSVDSTPLFVLLAGAYFERTGDIKTVTHLWPHIMRALEWIDCWGDRDGDGFVEYHRQTADGLVNQGWKDSYDSIFHADGTLAEGPIALCEVQAYVYGARRAAAMIAGRLGQSECCSLQNAKADDLYRRFDDVFWQDDIGTYAIALDRLKRPCRVKSSNAGQVLLTGLARPERSEVLIANLMRGEFFSGWGIRTIANAEPRYNPMSYHNGSVWPHDNALIARGFARYGHTQAVARLFHGLFEASIYIDLRRLPELFCGFARRRRQGPTFYPVACTPQAWAAAAPLSLLQSCLGLRFDPQQCHVIFERPMLPDFLDEVTLHGLAISGARIDVKICRADREVAIHVLEREGKVQLVTIN